MKPACFITLIFLHFNSDISAYNTSEIRFVLTGNSFIWRITDPFEDIAYYSVNENKYRNIAIKAYDKYVYIESPVKNWGFMFVKELDTIISLKEKSLISITSQSEKRSNELLFFHRMFFELGNERDFFTADFIKKHLTIQSLIKEVEKRYAAYNTFLEKYKREYSLSDSITSYYRDYMKISLFNFRVFISQTNLAKQSNFGLQSLLKESEEIVNLNQWDNPQYRRAIIYYYKITQQSNKVPQIINEKSQQNIINKSIYEYYSFLLTKQKIIDNPSTAGQIWNLEKDKFTNIGYSNYIQTLVNGSSIGNDVSLKLPKSLYSDMIMLRPELKLTLEKIIGNDSAGFFILDFWASWCGPCRHSIPLLKEFAIHQNNIKVIYLSIDKNYAAWQHASEAENLQGEYNFIIPNFNKTKLYSQFKIVSVPRYILIDKTGKVLSANLTAPDSKFFLNDLNRLTSNNSMIEPKR